MSLEEELRKRRRVGESSHTVPWALVRVGKYKVLEHLKLADGR